MKELTTKLYALVGLIMMMLVCVAGIASGQSRIDTLYVQNESLNQHKKPAVVPLSKVLEEIERTHHIRFLYQSDLIEGKTVPKVVLTSANLSRKLGKLLVNNGLTYEKQGNSTYIIKRLAGFQAMRRPAAAAQITGTVTDGSTGETLPGVNILVKGTTTGTSTDTEGNFELTVPSLQDTLVVSFIGYQTREVPINGRKAIDVALQSQAITGEEMVVVGYGTQRKRDVTGSISSVGEEQLIQQSPTTVFESLQGQMSGVQVTSNSGAPGSKAQIRVRGNTTFSGGNGPLYIVDGQPLDDIDNLNPQNIESVEVLKDGASAAIYGSRAANGVILITTKIPEEGTSNISLRYNKSFSNLRNMSRLNTNQWIKYQHTRGRISDELLLDKRNQAFTTINNNHLAILSRIAARDELNFTINSGTENTNFMWSTRALREQGVWVGTNYKKVGTRVNLSHKFNDWISSSLRSNFSFGIKDNIGLELENPLIGQSLTIAPIAAYYEGDGTPMTQLNRFETRRNALQELSNGGINFKRRDFSGNLLGDFEIDLLDNLSYRGNLGVEFDFIRNNFFYPPEMGPDRNQESQASYESGLKWNALHESILNFNKEIGGLHSISAIGGFSLQKWSYPQEYIGGVLANRLIPTLNNIQSLSLENVYTLDEQRHSLMSLFARVEYSYKDKYLFSGTIRRDGSSRFGPKNKWGSFPAVSAGWRFSEESFMDGIEFITDAKIRASYAVTGNERIGNRDYLTTLTTGKFYGGIGGIGVSDRLGNPAIKWEETKEKNIGLDISFFEGKLNFTADYYIKNTTDLLADKKLRTSSGLENIRVNIGEVENQGLEFYMEATPYDRADLRWETSLNFSTNTNSVKKMVDGTPIISNNHVTREGSALGSFYGYKVLGVFAYDESNAFTPGGDQLTPNFNGNGNFVNYTLGGEVYNGNVKQISVGGITPGGGDYNYEDANRDFVIDENDRGIVGSPFPQYFGGFRNTISYKNLSLSFMFNYQFDVEVFNKVGSTGSFARYNSSDPPSYVWENSWKEPGDNAQFSILEIRSQNQLGIYNNGSNMWVEDASYIRLQNVRLEYNIPLEKLGIGAGSLTRVTLHGSVNNALTWTNYRGFDPNVTESGDPLNAGIDYGRYPHSREFLIGINVDF